MTHHHNNRVPATRGGPNKVTAAQIEKALRLPPRLQEIGKEINARLAKVDAAFEQAENHKIAISQLLGETKALCDEGGFEVFREKFCLGLSNSRSYELHAIAAGRKTIEQTKAETRERQTKHRAKTMAKLAEAKAKLAEIEAANPVSHGQVRASFGHGQARAQGGGREGHRVARVQREDIEARADRPAAASRSGLPRRAYTPPDLLQLGSFLEKVAAAASTEAMKAEHAQLADVEQEAHAGDLEAVS